MSECPLGCGSIVPVRSVRVAGRRVIVCPACLAVGAAGEAFLDPRRPIDLARGIRRAVLRVREEGPLDPTTGLLAPSSFLERFARVLAEAKHRYFVCVVAVRVEVVAAEGVAQRSSKEFPLEEIMREVAVELRLAVREGDEVGRMEPDLLGIVIRGADRAAGGALAGRAVLAIEKRLAERGTKVRLRYSVASGEGRSPEGSWLLARGGFFS